VTPPLKNGKHYIDEVDYWSDKALTARLALQKAEDEMQRMESRKSAALADLERYVSGTEKDLATYREQVETAGKKAMALDLVGGKS
jgi:hypothetical protein